MFSYWGLTATLKDLKMYPRNAPESLNAQEFFIRLNDEKNSSLNCCGVQREQSGFTLSYSSSSRYTAPFFLRTGFCLKFKAWEGN